MGRCDDRGAFTAERVFPRRVPAARAKQGAVVRGAVSVSSGESQSSGQPLCQRLGAHYSRCVLPQNIAYCVYNCTAVRWRRCLLLQMKNLRGGVACRVRFRIQSLFRKRVPLPCASLSRPVFEVAACYSKGRQDVSGQLSCLRKAL